MGQRIYEDEPIAFGDRFAPALQLPPPLKSMRELGKSAVMQSRSRVFVMEAKLLSDFTLDAPWSLDVSLPYPTYEALNDRDLVGYFGWRTQYRAGHIQSAPLTYLCLYAFELLNLVGVKSATEAYQRLTVLRDIYPSPTFLKLSHQWLYDLVYVHQLDPSLLKGSKDWEEDQLLLALKEPLQADDSLVARAVLKATGITSACLAKKESTDVIASVYRDFSLKYRKDHGTSLFDAMFPRRHTKWLFPFEQAVVDRDRSKEEIRYVADGVRAFVRKDGFWSCEAYTLDGGRKATLKRNFTMLCTLLDEVWGLALPLTPSRKGGWLRSALDKALADLERKKRMAEPLDAKRIGLLKREADETRDMLVVPEAEEEPVQEAEQARTTDEPSLFSADERRFLRCLLEGSDLSWLREKGLMASNLVESVNGKMLDTVGDSVLELDDKGPVVVEDYRGDIEEALAS